MHTREDFPSFGHMIRNGATTIWEEWDGDNSQIHNTMISVGLWFIEGLAGIRCDEQAPGFQHFIAAPGVEIEADDHRIVVIFQKVIAVSEVISFADPAPQACPADQLAPPVFLDRGFANDDSPPGAEVVEPHDCRPGLA